jgi:hypothetical protein
MLICIMGAGGGGRCALCGQSHECTPWLLGVPAVRPMDQPCGAVSQVSIIFEGDEEGWVQQPAHE